MQQMNFNPQSAIQVRRPSEPSRPQSMNPQSAIRNPQSERGTILVTDDEPGMRLALREVLQRTGWRVALAESGEAAVQLLEADEPYDLMITDFRMPGMTGLDLLREARRLRPAMPCVMMTAYGTVEDAVTAMRAGARDYLMKPFSFDAVTEVVERALSAPAPAPAEGAAETAAPASEIPSPTAPRRARASAERAIICKGPALEWVLDIAGDVAEADSTVLLTGESGAGKEVIARHIHERSGRRGAFVAINCAALPEGLLESELFGHEKGAFTGAILARKGKFEQAAGGTLLLDEISEMPLPLQAKLLRVLQEKEISPIGSSSTIKLDVRIVATTNRDMERMVAEGDFRQDLYYRLNVIALRVPPLRERPEDILPLAEHFVTRFHRAGRPEQRLGDDVIEYLQNYTWPGNVRELENLMERACLLARGEVIRLADLHMNLSAESARKSDDILTINFDRPITLEEMEKRLILRTLDKTGGNRTRTADMLGVSVRTIRNKLHQYGFADAVEA